MVLVCAISYWHDRSIQVLPYAPFNIAGVRILWRAHRAHL